MNALTKNIAAVSLTFCVGVSLLLLVFDYINPNAGKESIFLLLVVGCSILLVGVLGFLAVCFSTFGLSDNKQALALPEGSVRALIALMLIVLFSISAIYLHGSLDQIRTIENVQADPETVKKLDPAKFFASKDGNTVYYYGGPSSEGADFAKQLLVMFGTLIASISSFYFGTRAATSSPVKSGGEETRATEPIAVEPGVVGPGKTPLFIRGGGLDDAKRVELVFDGRRIAASGFQHYHNLIRAEFNIAADTPDGPWDVEVSHDAGRPSLAPAAVKVAASGGK